MVLVLARIEPSVIRYQDLGGFWTMPAASFCCSRCPYSPGFFVFVVALGTSTEIQLLGGAGEASRS
jgi:hypothetical protein